MARSTNKSVLTCIVIFTLIMISWSAMNSNGFASRASVVKCTSAGCRDRSNAHVNTNVYRRSGSVLADAAKAADGKPPAAPNNTSKTPTEDTDSSDGTMITASSGAFDSSDSSSTSASTTTASTTTTTTSSTMTTTTSSTTTTTSTTKAPVPTKAPATPNTKKPSTPVDSDTAFFNNVSLMLFVLILVAGCYAVRLWRSRRNARGHGGRAQPDVHMNKSRGESVSGLREEYVKTVQTDSTQEIPGVPSTTQEDPTSYDMPGGSTPKPFAKPFETDNGREGEEEEMVTTFPAKYSMEALRRKQLAHAEGEQKAASHHRIAAVKVASLQMPPTTAAGGRMRLRATPATLEVPATTTVHVDTSEIQVSGGEGTVADAAQPGNTSPPLDAGNDEEWGW